MLTSRISASLVTRHISALRCIISPHPTCDLAAPRDASIGREARVYPLENAAMSTATSTPAPAPAPLARKVKFVASDPSRGGLPVKRKQVQQACVACRRKKVSRKPARP